MTNFKQEICRNIFKDEMKIFEPTYSICKQRTFYNARVPSAVGERIQRRHVTEWENIVKNRPPTTMKWKIHKGTNTGVFYLYGHHLPLQDLPALTNIEFLSPKDLTTMIYNNLGQWQQQLTSNKISRASIARPDVQERCLSTSSTVTKPWAW